MAGPTWTCIARTPSNFLPFYRDPQGPLSGDRLSNAGDDWLPPTPDIRAILRRQIPLPEDFPQSMTDHRGPRLLFHRYERESAALFPHTTFRCILPLWEPRYIDTR